MSKNDFEEFQKQMQKMFGSGANMNSPFGFQAEPEQEEPSDETEAEEEVDVFEKIKSFNLKPREIRDELDRFVIKQSEAKKVLSVAVCDHYNHVRRAVSGDDKLGDEYAKQNILVLGPTGVGKTYLLKCIARIIGVPFVKADATKFSETGYVGRDVEDMVRDLVKSADGNVELAEFGIIYIDEIDKLSSSGQSSKDVSGKGVQINLLKLMEEAEVALKSQMDMMGQMESMMDMMNQRTGKKRRQSINTRHILFIVSGAFSNLAESIQRRMTGSKIGFMSDEEHSEDASDFLKYVETSDLVKYGFEPEFIGRLPVRVACESLNKSDLRDVLTNSQGSILNQYIEDFAGYGINFDMNEEALTEIANKAYAEKTGARGLMTVLERLFRHFKFELPSTQINEFAIDESTVDNPEQALEELLNANKDLHRKTLARDVADFVVRFKNEHDFTLKFNKSAIEAIIDISLESGKTVRAVCEEKFRDFPYGLKLISENTNQDSFEITKKVIKDPDKELSNWVVKRFQDGDKKNTAES